MADSAYVLHLLHRVEHDIEFLQEQGALSYEDAALITTKLKEAEVLNLPAAAAPSAASASRGGSQSNGSRVADLSRQMSGMSVGGSKVGRSVPPPPAAAASAAAAAAGTGAVASEAGVVGIGKARAVWDYVKVQPDDLGFKKGDVIVLLEESNADWWKGQIGQSLWEEQRVLDGRTGLTLPGDWAVQATASGCSLQTYVRSENACSSPSVRI